MKFGKTFEKALEEEDIPDEWKAAAIKYKSLKVRRAPGHKMARTDGDYRNVSIGLVGLTRRIFCEN